MYMEIAAGKYWIIEPTARERRAIIWANRCRARVYLWWHLAFTVVVVATFAVLLVAVPFVHPAVSLGWFVLLGLGWWVVAGSARHRLRKAARAKRLYGIDGYDWYDTESAGRQLVRFLFSSDRALSSRNQMRVLANVQPKFIDQALSDSEIRYALDREECVVTQEARLAWLRYLAHALTDMLAEARPYIEQYQREEAEWREKFAHVDTTESHEALKQKELAEFESYVARQQ